jgi:hypothetical protein
MKSQPLNLVRILCLLLISLVLSILLYKIWDSDYVYTHKKHFLSNEILYLDFNKLKPITIEQTKNQYKLNWWCRVNFELLEFGDNFCADELKGWDDIPAMTVVFWYKNEKLNAAKIDIPYWHHSKVIEKIKKEYGEPIKKSHQISYLNAARKLGLLMLTKGKYSGEDEVFVENRGIWELKTGAWIETEIKPSGDIFSHNTILWRSPEDVKKIKSTSNQGLQE